MPAEQRRASMPGMMRLIWPVRLGCAPEWSARPEWSVSLAGAAGTQSLFDTGPVSFTQFQATRGQAAYIESCAACHGPNLDDGQFAPPVKGVAFKTHWHDQSPAALRSLIVKRMPPASPGSLGSRTYTDIEAYLLQENGDRAGTAELAASSAPAELAAASEHDSSPRTIGAALVDNQDAEYRAAMAARRILLDRLTPVSDAMLRSPAASDWLMWRGTYDTLGYSPLDQINRTHGAQSWRRLDIVAAAERQRGRAVDPRRRAVH